MTETRDKDSSDERLMWAHTVLSQNSIGSHRWASSPLVKHPRLNEAPVIRQDSYILSKFSEWLYHRAWEMHKAEKLYLYMIRFVFV